MSNSTTYNIPTLPLDIGLESKEVLKQLSKALIDLFMGKQETLEQVSTIESVG